MIASAPTQTAFFPVPAAGACRVCGRTLTDPTSVQAGIGPICAAMHRRTDPMPDDRATIADLPHGRRPGRYDG